MRTCNARSGNNSRLWTNWWRVSVSRDTALLVDSNLNPDMEHDGL